MQRLAPVDKEWIYQTWVVTNNKSETARRCRVSIGSVNNVLKELQGKNPDKPQLPETRADRAQRHADMADRICRTADMALESITPDDMDSGRFPITEMRTDSETGEDKEVVVGYRYYGPSAVQKATTFGILKDKETQQINIEQDMLQDVQSGKLMLPSELSGMVDEAKRMIKDVSILHVRFEEENPDLLTTMKEVIAEAEVLEESRPDVKSFNEFDNPKD